MRTTLSLLAVIFFFSACSTNNVTVDDSLGRFFDSTGVKGDFALFDNGQGRFTIYNLPRYRDSAYSPGATFDILQSLIAFQTGVRKDNNVVVDQTYGIPAGETNDSVDARLRRGDTSGITVSPVTMRLAFQRTSPINDIEFRKLAADIGMDTLKKWVDSLHYGNMKLSGDPAAFWKNDSLKISSDEQLGLTKKLYFNQLPFFRRSQELVRDMMITESNSNYKLVYKTARIAYPDHVMGWVMGWVEENKHPYFFILNIVSPDTRADISAIGLQLVKSVLSSEGFFQGKK